MDSLKLVVSPIQESIDRVIASSGQVEDIRSSGGGGGGFRPGAASGCSSNLERRTRVFIGAVIDGMISLKYIAQGAAYPSRPPIK